MVKNNEGDFGGGNSANKNETGGEQDNNYPYDILTHEPTFEEREKQRSESEEGKGNVIKPGEVSKVIVESNGNRAIESEYLDLYYDYKKNSGAEYDEELGQAIWAVGFGMALLDLDQKVTKDLSEEGLIEIENLDKSSTKQYKKVWNGLIDMLESNKREKVEQALKKMKETGKVGEFFAEAFQAINDTIVGGAASANQLRFKIEESELPDKKEDDSEVIERFNELEQRFAKMMSSRGIDLEEVDKLYSEYSSLSSSVFNPERAEIIEDRKNRLFDISDKLKKVNTASFD